MIDYEHMTVAEISDHLDVLARRILNDEERAHVERGHEYLDERMKLDAPDRDVAEALDACFFCHNVWGECTCVFDDPDDEDADGFESEGQWITHPNVTCCTRFFINPETYYGKPYLEWAAKHPPMWFTTGEPAK